MIGSCSSSQPRHFFFFLFFFLFFFFFVIPFLTLAQQFSVDIDSANWDIPPKSLCLSQEANFSHSQFFYNLKRLVSSINSLRSNTYNFYNLSIGTNSDKDKVEAIGLCNRVVTRVECLNCISQAANNLTTIYCPGHREAHIRSTKCMFRYSDKPIFGKLTVSPVLEISNPHNAAANRTEFIGLQSELLIKLRREAAGGGPKRKYAQGDGPGPGPPPYNIFFATTQCTPDLSHKDCNRCLHYGFQNATKGRIGNRWFCPSCNFQIESGLRFFLLDYGPDRSMKSGISKTKSIIATVGSVVCLVMIIICLYFFLTRERRKEKQSLEGKDVKDSKIKDAQLFQMDIDTIRLATNDFSSNNHLGEGGFGAVYKGVLVSGEEVAVKRLSMKSGQGDNEFINEVSLVAKLQHRNLVTLLGFCIDGEERLLIYEFFKNTSLEHYIFDSNRRMILEWETRKRIVSGVARGLLYLHEDSRIKIIHRDLKASNVLLDDEMYPKIADFGMAKLFDTDQTNQIKFTSKVSGTYGYMAPEYAMNGQFSVKTDVYSFGVLILEIITGKKHNWSPEEETSLFLLSYVWKCWREGGVLNIVDPTLIESKGLSDEIMKCIHIGLLCVQENAESRPTMAYVVVMLSASSFTLPIPSQPGFCPLDGESSSSRGNHTSSIPSFNSVSITQLVPR
ncbi:Cysteine-rich receptor-like protein kinase 41 [Hirschfeldia incana]|nr:Cysteine-rich receptor-like protein kinase 41 [Hirschfeldia incana]